MNRQEIIARLRENEAELRTRGVVHAALFGSRAREVWDTLRLHLPPLLAVIEQELAALGGA